MSRIRECVEKVGTYAGNLVFDSVGLGVTINDFRNNPGRLEQLREQVSHRKGIQKIVPFADYASQMLFLIAGGFILPSFSRGIAAAAQKDEFNSTVGTSEYSRYGRDSAVSFFGLIPDSLIFVHLGSELSYGHPEALALKLLYNSVVYATLDVMKVPRISESLKTRFCFTSGN